MSLPLADSYWNACVGLGCVIPAVVDFLSTGWDCTQQSGNVADDEPYEESEGESAIEGDDQHPVPEPDESVLPSYLVSLFIVVTGSRIFIDAVMYIQYMH